MYTLYTSTGTCSLAVNVVLEELGVPYKLEIISLKNGDNKKPEFQKVNPRGSVPVLVREDGKILREGAAIILYLLEKYPNELLPKSGDARTDAIEWLLFANSTLHPAYGRGFWALKGLQGEAKDTAIQSAVESINKLWAEVDARLAKQKFIAGDNPTAADILLTVFTGWNGAFQPKPEIGKNVERLVADITSRPAFIRAKQAESGQAKAA